MILTDAKALVRSFFYLEYLLSKLSSHMIRGSNHLVLLGLGNEEPELLEALGVPAFRIQSVENNRKIYDEQFRRYQSGELKASLYCGELIDFVTHYLQTNDRFQVLNLDICGQYRTKIHPVMTEVLLFTRRNPRTVVATYSNIGRDDEQLAEGLKSLAIFRWLAPEVTADLVDWLYGSYIAAGKTPERSFRMCLRHLFWLRSHLEHIALGRVAMGKEPAEKVLKLFTEHHALWERAWKQVSLPIGYGEFLAIIDSLPKTRRTPKFWDVSLDDVTLVTYDAAHPWRHTGWFATYSHVPVMNQVDWVTGAMRSMMTTSLRYAAKESASLLTAEPAEAVPTDLRIWTSKQTLPIFGAHKAPLVNLASAVKDVTPGMRVESEADVDEVIDIVPLIRELALQGLKTDEVIERIQGSTRQ